MNLQFYFLKAFGTYLCSEVLWILGCKDFFIPRIISQCRLNYQLKRKKKGGEPGEGEGVFYLLQLKKGFVID